MNGDIIFPKPQPYEIQVALSGIGQSISAGLKKGTARVPFPGTVTGFHIACDPGDKPSSVAVEVDVGKVDPSTAAVTSILSAVATIATGQRSGSGTIDGTQTVAAGDWLQFDVDQGSDGGLLTGTVLVQRS